MYRLLGHLADAEWGQWSNHEIARRSRVTQRFVGTLRRGLSGNNSQMRARKARRGDQVYEMKVEPRNNPIPAPANDSKEACHPASVPTIVSDRLGFTLHQQSAPAFATKDAFETASSLYAQLAGQVDQIARNPGGAAYLQHMGRRLKDDRVEFFSPELRIFIQKLRSAEPHCGSCPRCLVKHGCPAHPACKLCSGRGWLSKSEWDACPQHERRELERLHAKQPASMPQTDHPSSH
jgi:hypothetical protein